MVRKPPNESLWENWKKFMSIAGMFVSVVVVIFGLGGEYNEVHAYGPRIKTLEEWKIQEGQDMAVIRWKIDQMYDHIVPKKDQ